MRAPTEKGSVTNKGVFSGLVLSVAVDATLDDHPHAWLHTLNLVVYTIRILTN